MMNCFHYFPLFLCLTIPYCADFLLTLFHCVRKKKREPLNTSIPLPHFQSGGGMLNHTAGTYSHNGVIDPEISDFGIASGKFPDSVQFQSWKVNFSSEVCPRTADTQITLHWIKEVEMAMSIGELMTSRSIVGRRDFPDFDVLDAMIASALKRLLDKYIHFRTRVSVEEQRAQNSDRFLRERQNCVVKITGLCSASDCLGFVRPRNCSKQWTDQLFTIEDSCKTSEP